jgi:hypothetical protein
MENGVAIVGLGEKFWGLAARTTWSQFGTMKEREKRDPFFILPGKSINNHIFFSLLVNDLIIISKYLGHPFLLLWG